MQMFFKLSCRVLILLEAPPVVNSFLNLIAWLFSFFKWIDWASGRHPARVIDRLFSVTVESVRTSESEVQILNSKFPKLFSSCSTTSQWVSLWQISQEFQIVRFCAGNENDMERSYWKSIWSSRSWTKNSMTSRWLIHFAYRMKFIQWTHWMIFLCKKRFVPRVLERCPDRMVDWWPLRSIRWTGEDELFSRRERLSFGSSTIH